MAGNPSAAGAKLGLDYKTGRAVPFTAPRSTYLALCTADFADNVALSALPELTTPGYARQLIPWGDATLARPSVASNTAVITTGPFTADVASPITYAAMVTVSTGSAGEVLYKWQLAAAQQPVNGQALQIAVTKLAVQES